MTTIWYDSETDSVHAPYARLKLFGFLTDKGKIHKWKAPFSDSDIETINEWMNSPTIKKVGFNCLNYDDVVLDNHGIIVNEINRHDGMIAMKTVFPGLPAYSLKFLNWYLFGDPHWPEHELEMLGINPFVESHDTPEIEKYHAHDLLQHKNLWDYVEPYLLKRRHMEAYMLDMGMGLPLRQMIFEGGLYVDVPKAEATLARLQGEKDNVQREVCRITNGDVKNANSGKQVGKYLSNIEKVEVAFTATGEFSIKKKDMKDLAGVDEDYTWNSETTFESVAECAYVIKEIETLRKYVVNYKKAAVGGKRPDGWIPTSFTIDSAATRRTLSKSFYKINFQNSTTEIDEFKMVPKGYYAWKFDSTQIENVVHIHESQDTVRAAAYIADEDWNEYVWLCNRILGRNADKKELDSIKSKQVPHWSVYKLYKTVKLALNFGMGVRKFCKTLGITENVGRKVFEDIHDACPAIRRLQKKVEMRMQRDGFVEDVFGHIYGGDEPYKIVAYLIQGCGTGSLPKAQIRANFDTLQRWSADLSGTVGVMGGTTHDDNWGYIRKGEETETILKEMFVNMTNRFSDKFGGLPLRAKLYLSETTFGDMEEVQLTDY